MSPREKGEREFVCVCVKDVRVQKREICVRERYVIERYVCEREICVCVFVCVCVCVCVRERGEREKESAANLTELILELIFKIRN